MFIAPWRNDQEQIRFFWFVVVCKLVTSLTLCWWFKCALLHNAIHWNCYTEMSSTTALLTIFSTVYNTTKTDHNIKCFNDVTFIALLCEAWKMRFILCFTTILVPVIQHHCLNALNLVEYFFNWSYRKLIYFCGVTVHCAWVSSIVLLLRCLVYRRWLCHLPFGSLWTLFFEIISCQALKMGFLSKRNCTSKICFENFGAEKNLIWYDQLKDAYLTIFPWSWMHRCI